MDRKMKATRKTIFQSFLSVYLASLVNKKKLPTEIASALRMKENRLFFIPIEKITRRGPTVTPEVRSWHVTRVAVLDIHHFFVQSQSDTWFLATPPSPYGTVHPSQLPLKVRFDGHRGRNHPREHPRAMTRSGLKINKTGRRWWSVSRRKAGIIFIDDPRASLREISGKKIWEITSFAEVNVDD